MEVRCERRRGTKKGLFVLEETFVSFSPPLSVFEAAKSASTGKIIASFACCLEFILIAHHFWKGIYRMLCLHVQFVQIMTKLIYCSELSGANK